jgi:hypothetical protein
MGMTPQKERKLIEDVQTLTGERDSKLGRALRTSDLLELNSTGADLRSTARFLSDTVNALSVRVTNAENTIIVHTAQIAANTADIADHETRIDALELGGVGGTSGSFDLDDGTATTTGGFEFEEGGA